MSEKLTEFFVGFWWTNSPLESFRSASFGSVDSAAASSFFGAEIVGGGTGKVGEGLLSSLILGSDFRRILLGYKKR